MIYNICYSDIVLKKDLPKLAHSVKLKIKQSIEAKLLLDPIKFGKPLRYNLKNCRSLRVEDYRVIYQIWGQEIRILTIKHRSVCYE